MCGLVTYLFSKTFHPFNKCSCGARSFNKGFIPYQVFPSPLPRPGCATGKVFWKAWEGSEVAGYLAGAGGTCDGYLHAWGRGGCKACGSFGWLVGLGAALHHHPTGHLGAHHQEIIIIYVRNSM